MSLEREYVINTDLQYRKSAGQGVAEFCKPSWASAYSRSSDIPAQRRLRTARTGRRIPDLTTFRTTRSPEWPRSLRYGGLNVGKVAICYCKSFTLSQTCRSASFPRIAFSAPILVLQLFRHLSLRSATFPTSSANGSGGRTKPEHHGATGSGGRSKSEHHGATGNGGRTKPEHHGATGRWSQR